MSAFEVSAEHINAIVHAWINAGHYAGSSHARSRTLRDQETALPACDRRPARQVSR
jgi:hypothetical protein